MSIFLCIVIVPVFGQIETVNIPLGGSLEIEKTHTVPFTPSNAIFIPKFGPPPFYVSASPVSITLTSPNTVTVKFSLTLSGDAQVGETYSKSFSYLYLGGPGEEHEVEEEYNVVAEAAVGIIGNESKIVEHYTLNQNYPNPFNPATTISYKLKSANNVELTIYNQLGRKVVTLVNERQSGGTHQVQWDGEIFTENW
jgi:hypothetical protein